jgi:hypothetical protein
MLVQEKLWKPINDFFDLFFESYNNALGIGLKLSVHPLFAKSNALGIEILFTQNNLENSKQPRNFSKIQYVTTDDVYYL